jgi:hypothetical protein
MSRERKRGSARTQNIRTQVSLVTVEAEVSVRALLRRGAQLTLVVGRLVAMQSGKQQALLQVVLAERTSRGLES